MQRDHVHLIVEAENAKALSSGVRSVAIRIARYVNDLLSRRGPLWADRWHGRALTSPREVRNALVYVLANFRKHAARSVPPGLDRYSSAVWFDGWRGWAPCSGLPPPFAPLRRALAGSRRTAVGLLRTPGGDASTTGGAELDGCPVVPARTWLARKGWRRHGLLGTSEAPRS